MNIKSQCYQPLAGTANNGQHLNTNDGYMKNSEREKKQIRPSKTDLPCIYIQPVFHGNKYNVLL